MSKKKTKPEENGVHTNGIAVLDAPGVKPPDPPLGAPASEQSPTGPPSEPQAQSKNRPAASFAAMSDRTTRLEVAVWGRVVKNDREEYTQHAITIQRSYRDKDGKWHENGFYRVHDIPVLQFLIAQAYNWCLNTRTEVRFGDEPLPF